VRLDWEVDQEQEIATYVIERSVNGTEFMPVSDQPALGEDGELQYTGYDENPVIGDTYYRIRALGADGEELTSQTVKVTYAIPGATALVYPNPLHGAHTRLTVDLQLDLPEYVDFQIFSQDGRIIHREARDLAAGQSFVQFDLGSWPKGFYVLRMRGEQWDVVKRVVVQ
jgi:hypothetical protein